MRQKKIAVLIVEDNVLIALQLMQALRRAGFDALASAANGADAVQAVRQHPPDLIVMDIRLMGDMDGIDAMQAIRAFSNVPVIFATGHAERAFRERAQVFSPVAFLVKPLHVPELVEIIRSYFQRVS